MRKNAFSPQFLANNPFFVNMLLTHDLWSKFIVPGLAKQIVFLSIFFSVFKRFFVFKSVKTSFLAVFVFSRCFSAKK